MSEKLLKEAMLAISELKEAIDRQPSASPLKIPGIAGPFIQSESYKHARDVLTRLCQVTHTDAILIGM